MNALLAMSANIRAQRERGKEEALAGFASRFATFSTARGKAVQNNTQQDNGSAAQSAPAGTGAGTDGNGGDGGEKKRRRGRKPKGGK